jgi:hypothetical protein
MDKARKTVHVATLCVAQHDVLNVEILVEGMPCICAWVNGAAASICDHVLLRHDDTKQCNAPS